MGFDQIRVIGKEKRPATVEVVINSGYTHWVGDEKYGAGEQVSIPEKDYLGAKRKFQLVEDSHSPESRDADDKGGKKKVIKPQANKSMAGRDDETESK